MLAAQRPGVGFNDWFKETPLLMGFARLFSALFLAEPQVMAVYFSFLLSAAPQYGHHRLLCLTSLPDRRLG
jgi:hypothetical protein